MSIKCSLISKYKGGGLHIWKHCFTEEYYLEFDYTCVLLNMFEAKEIVMLLKKNKDLHISQDEIDVLDKVCEDYRIGELK